MFVDDADAGFVGAAGNGLDVGCGLAFVLESLVDVLGGLDGGLGVEFGYGTISMTSLQRIVGSYLGRRP